MPGLRSLIARRRCSLPADPLILPGKVSCSYTAVNTQIESPILRRRSSLDLVPLSIQESKPNGCDSSKVNISKWDLTNIFSIKNSNESEIQQSSTLHKENVCIFSTNSRKSSVADEIYKDNNEKCLISNCSPILKEGNLDVERLNSCDHNKASSPERIVIKMKFLPTSSISINNSKDQNYQSIDNSLSEFCHLKNINIENTSTTTLKNYKNAWKIDTIGSKPAILNSLDHCNLSAHKTDDESLFDNPVKSKGDLDALPSCGSIPSVNIVSQNAETNANNELKSFLPKNCITSPNVIKGLRRTSDDSDISETSVSSDLSFFSTSSISSTDSKPCNIVIKRLNDTNHYSCFYNSKRKMNKNNLRPRVSIKPGSSPVIYIPKQLLNFSFDQKVLPCSVILCNIFSRISLVQLKCPNCCILFKLESDISIDINNLTIALICKGCNWLVLRKLMQKCINYN